MPTLKMHLELDRCPHCRLAKPCLKAIGDGKPIRTIGQLADNRLDRQWLIYICSGCGGLVTAFSSSTGAEVGAHYPSDVVVDTNIPSPALDYLNQAYDSLHAPAGAIMLSASAVDAMLKAKGLIEGNLFTRIQAAAEQHLITDGMAAWAHDVRLEANDQRHADEDAALPTRADAARSVDFAAALAEFLFVLPARIARGQSGGS